MVQVIKNEPDIAEAFDCSEVKVYYKKSGNFLFSTLRQVRKNFLSEWKQWNIQCDCLPDRVIINGSEFDLVPVDINIKIDNKFKDRK